MRNKRNIFTAIVFILIIFAWYNVFSILQTQQAAAQEKTDTIGIHSVAQQIVVDGVVTPQDEVTLHFQTGGKLTYLPFKQGDHITQGQTIAQLDTYALQRELTQALNTYRTNRDAFDQTQQYNSAGVLNNEQSTTLKSAGAGIGGDQNYSIVADTAKRIVDENQANLDNSVINVELANYALQLSTLTSPLSGIVTHEDVTVAGENIVPTTGFTVADPQSIVFRANINENDIDFVQVGALANVQINGLSAPVSGIVNTIYPDKQTLPNGTQVYQVDIAVNKLPELAKIDQTGVVEITSSESSSVMLVPTWTILNHQYIWVEENGEPILKKVQVGVQHGSETEILSGLSSQDKVVVNPSAIAAKKYQLLHL